MKLFKQAFLVVFGISSLGFVAPAALSQMPQIGLEFEGFGLNQAQTTITQFTGECAGEDGGKVKAHFISSVNPPSSKRRVVIRNITEGVNSTKIPYSDREYDRGRGSEGIKMVPGASHKQRAFTYIPNKVNTFEFDIIQDKQVIEKGIFDAYISANIRTASRNMTWQSQTFCIDTESTDMDGCKNPGVREVGSCPNGSKLQYRNVQRLNNPEEDSETVIIFR